MSFILIVFSALFLYLLCGYILLFARALHYFCCTGMYRVCLVNIPEMPFCSAVSFQLCQMPSGLAPPWTHRSVSLTMTCTSLGKKKNQTLGLSQRCCVQSEVQTHLWNQKRGCELWQRTLSSPSCFPTRSSTFLQVVSARKLRFRVKSGNGRICLSIMCLLEWWMNAIELWNLNLSIKRTNTF